VTRADFCRMALQSGMDAVPCGRVVLSRGRRESKTIYDDMKPEKRVSSHPETLSNPCTGSRFLPCSPEQKREYGLSRHRYRYAGAPFADRLNGKGMFVYAVCARRPGPAGSRSLFLYTAALPG